MRWCWFRWLVVRQRFGIDAPKWSIDAKRIRVISHSRFALLLATPLIIITVAVWLVMFECDLSIFSIYVCFNSINLRYILPKRKQHWWFDNSIESCTNQSLYYLCSLPIVLFTSWWCSKKLPLWRKFSLRVICSQYKRFRILSCQNSNHKTNFRISSYQILRNNLFFFPFHGETAFSHLK